jgi:hypothetical protein
MPVAAIASTGALNVTAYAGGRQDTPRVQPHETAGAAACRLHDRGAATRQGTLLPLQLLEVRASRETRSGSPAAGELEPQRPLHKFRWVHVPGSFHQGLTPFYGKYTYVVTPRYFDADGSLRPLESARSTPIDVNVAPFASGVLDLAFTRGYVQSQAFVGHFGPKAHIRPQREGSPVRHRAGRRSQRHGRAVHIPRRVPVARIDRAREGLRAPGRGAQEQEAVAGRLCLRPQRTRHRAARSGRQPRPSPSG